MKKYLVVILGLIMLFPINIYAADSYNSRRDNNDRREYDKDNGSRSNRRPSRQPVYATPIYTYDDYNNRHRDNYSYSHYTPVYEPLGVSCYSSITEASVGDTVVWNASVYGGNGNYYVTWSGTNGFSSTGSSATMRYYSGGSKSASVTVRSGNQTISRNCNNILVHDYSIQYPPTPVYNYYDNYNHNYDYDFRPRQSLQVTCYPSYSNVRLGSLVTWTATAYGANGNYQYSWFGNDGVYSNGSSASLQYNTPGSKSASVTVFADGQRISKNCGYVSVY